ncbi:MAG: 16S rRNA (adenine(1518)-N(6)/adenine(1519)-N(6))-dimethyltransferase [Paludibacter sp.]|nr:MAG: 16S rRNA (adenine(1518)-N(6)/adenine(1519)-N(6))-dimethyltransferase [Paludibacter sp.]
MNQVRAKKYLGQHFLTDENIARRVAEGFTLHKASSVLEIGSGMGVLTQFLLKNPLINLTAIEIDKESVEYLDVHYPELNVIQDDFLAMDLDKLFDDDFYIIGNFPYNISSQILFKALDHKHKVKGIAGMFQKEVGERIVSPPGNKSYGILSVLLQAYYDAEYLFTVSEEVFNPPPKVKSAVVRFTRNDVQQLDCNEKLFKNVVKTAFNQRRKTLRNSLKSMIDKENPIRNESIFDKRPERLGVDEFVYLTQIIENSRK